MSRSLFVCFCLLVSFTSSAQPYKYLVMKGGGIRGIAYTGAIKVLEEENISQHIEKVAGTSVGAIVGSLYSVGYTAEEMEDLMLGLDIKTFNDGQGYFIGGQRRLRKNYGWYKGNKLEAWIGDLIEEKTGIENITFMQLHILAQKNKNFRDLYVTATNLSKQRLEVFSWETYPDMPVLIAVRASVAIPLYYRAVLLDSAGNVVDKPNAATQNDVFIDGGILDNYPLTIFKDSNNTTESVSQYTLGLKLERPEQIDFYKNADGIAPYHINSFGSYLAALYNMLMEQLNKNLTHEEEKKHTIYISTSNLSPRVRHMSDEQKKLLYDNGFDAAKHFFEKAH